MTAYPLDDKTEWDNIPKIVHNSYWGSIQQLNKDKNGNYIDGKYFNNLRFADDIVFIPDNLLEKKGMKKWLEKSARENW